MSIKHSKRIPILMYHSVDSINRGEGLRSLHVPKWLFKLQLFILNLLGYRGLDMDRLLPYLKGEKTGKVFGITFDDGYENNYLNALPILMKYKFSATCYVIADNIGGDNYWDIKKGFLPHKMMTHAQIRNWINSGMTIGSHSLNHIKLTETDASVMKKEILESKSTLEKEFSIKINHFCYPFGSFNSDTEKFVKFAGYKSAVTVSRGVETSNSNLFRLSRVFITHRTYPHLFLLKLFSSYEKPRKK